MMTKVLFIAIMTLSFGLIESNRKILKLDTDNNQVIIRSSRRARVGTCLFDYGPFGKCAYVDKGTAKIRNHTLPFCPIAEEHSCQSKYYADVDDTAVWSGCQQYRTRGDPLVDCPDDMSYDCFKHKCVYLSDMTQAPCPLFWGDNAVQEMSEMVKELEPIGFLKEKPIYKATWRGKGYQLSIGDSGRLFRLCSIAWSKDACGYPCCSHSLLELECYISDNLDKICVEEVMKPDGGIMFKPGKLNTTHMSGYPPIPLDTPHIVHHLSINDSTLKLYSSIRPNPGNCTQTYLKCRNLLFHKFEHSTVPNLVHSTVDEHPEGRFSCESRDDVVTEADCYSLCLTKGTELCDGDDDYKKFFKGTAVFNCYCTWNYEISTKEVYEVGNIMFDKNDCEIVRIESDCSGHVVAQRAVQLRRLHEVTKNADCNKNGSHVICGIAECHYMMTYRERHVVGRRGELMILPLLIRDLLTDSNATVKYKCDKNIHRDFTKYEVKQNKRTGKITGRIEGGPICPTLGWWSFAVPQCDTMKSMSLSYGASTVVITMGSLAIIVTCIGCLNYFKRFLHYCGICVNKRDLVEKMILEDTPSVIKTQQQWIIDSYAVDAYSNYGFCSYKYWLCYKRRAIEKIANALFIQVAITGNGVEAAELVADKFRTDVKNGVIDKDILSSAASSSKSLKTIVEIGERRRPARNAGTIRKGLLPLLAIIGLVACPGECIECSGDSIDVSSSTCVKTSEEIETCHIDRTVSSIIDVIGQSVCINLINKTNSEVVGTINIEYEMLEREWTTSNLYYTGDWTMETELEKSCYNGGYCTAQCDGSTKKYGYRTKRSLNNGKIQPMISSCCYWGVFPSQCKDFYKCGAITLMINTEGAATHGWVKSIGKGEPLTSVKVKTLTTGGTVKETSKRIRGVGTEVGHSYSISVHGVSNLPQISFGQKKLFITNLGQAFLTLASDVNNPIASTLGDVQSGSKEEWTTPQQAKSENDHLECFRVAPIWQISCSKWDTSNAYNEPGIRILEKRIDHDLLPNVFEGSSFTYGGNDMLLEELAGGRPLSLTIRLSGEFAVKIIKTQCDPEFVFKSIIGCFSCSSPGAIVTVETRSKNPYSCTTMLITDPNYLTCSGSVTFESGDLKERNISCLCSKPDVDVKLSINYGISSSIQVQGTLIADRLLAAQIMGSGEGNSTDANDAGIDFMNIIGYPIIGILSTLFIIIGLLLIFQFSATCSMWTMAIFPCCLKCCAKLPNRMERVRTAAVIGHKKAKEGELLDGLATDMKRLKGKANSAIDKMKRIGIKLKNG